ncbi:MAG TPA: hypothetical protein VK048_01380, partial [Atopostipes sp.]|nr:hypothetical protein [Atopostipes sp.]
ATEEKWISGAGHEIRVGKYRFSAVPVSTGIIVSELNTGHRVHKFTLTPDVVMYDKAELMDHFMELGKDIKKIIDSVDSVDFEKMLQDAQKRNEKLGPMPGIEDVYL